MATEKTQPLQDIEALSFESALKELEDIVRQLESGDAPLERSIELYERGTKLKARCEALLKAAEAKVEKITLSSDGAPRGGEPLDVE